jgi:hypothetical protein
MRPNGGIGRGIERDFIADSVQDRPKSGGPRIASADQKRYVWQLHLSDWTLAASSTTTILGLRRISDQTIPRNRLRDAGLILLEDQSYITLSSHVTMDLNSRSRNYMYIHLRMMSNPTSCYDKIIDVYMSTDVVI